MAAGTAQHMFHSADVDGSGYLDAAELAAVLDKKVRRPICNALLPTCWPGRQSHMRSAH